MKLLLTFAATGDEIARIRGGMPAGWEVVAPEGHGMTRFEVRHEDIAHLCEGVDAIVAWVVPPRTWDAVPDLKALAWLHAGCDELDFEMLRRRGVAVCNIRGGNAITVAEHAMTLMLGLARKVVQRHLWVQEARWQPTWHPDFMGVALEGRSLAIIGLGMIGTAVARRAKAFDMKVHAIRRHPERGGEFVDSVRGPDALHEVLSEADFVVLATPITRETEGFIDAAALACMKPGAFLINVARGNLVVEQALCDALEGGKLRGYAADVWWSYTESLPPSYHYPIPSRTGLHRLPNVIASGDQAANVEGVTERLLDMATESLAAFARGETMPRAIDLTLGY